MKPKVSASDLRQACESTAKANGYTTSAPHDQAGSRCAPPRLRVVVDTREQRPFTFAADVEVVRAKLATGDYSAVGYEEQVTVERKALADLHACIGRERERFEREIARLRGFVYSVIVVEADLRDILTTSGRLLNASAVLGSLVAWTLDGVPVVPCSSPQLAAAFVERFLRKAVKRLDAHTDLTLGTSHSPSPAKPRGRPRRRKDLAGSRGTSSARKEREHQ